MCVWRVQDERATPSKSRINTAIWARFAASATRVKSLRKTSVDADLICAGGGGRPWLVGDCCVEAMNELCWVLGDEIGAFIVSFLFGYLALREATAVKVREPRPWNRCR